MEAQANNLFITCLEKEGPFLRVWGQTDKNIANYIDQVLGNLGIQFDNGLCIPHPDTLQVDTLCCVKDKDNKYYRAKVTSVEFTVKTRYIEVNFIDHGHKDVVPLSHVRSIECFDNPFVTIPPQANSFLLAEAVCPQGKKCLKNGCF